MKKTIFLLGFCAFFAEIQAQIELDAYSASTIPKEILKDAHAVVRRGRLKPSVSVGERE